MANTTNYNWETPDDTDLVKDGAAAIRTLGSAVDTTVFNNAAAAIAKSIVDAKGDIIAATAADTVSRLAVGANNTVLTADSSTATGLKWATPAGGGKLLQMVHATYSTFTRNSTSTLADTGLTATITPTLSTSKILILMFQQIGKSANDSTNRVAITLFRGATAIHQAQDLARTDYAGETVQGYTLNIVDSPATTSATTYKTQFKNAVNGPIVDMYNNANYPAQMILLEIGA